MGLKRADCISNLNYLFIHTMERETKQQRDKSQAAENSNELWKKTNKDGQFDNIPANYQCGEANGDVQRKKQF